MSRDEYQKAFEAATREMEVALQQKAELEQRILHLRQTLLNLSHLLGYTPTVSWGLSDGIRYMLRKNGRAMTAVEVRGELAAWGFDMSKYANDLSAIHTTLKRLHKAGELRFTIRDGSHAYEVMRPITPVVMTKAEWDHEHGPSSFVPPSPRKKR
jgi:hypothetical protein